MELVSVSRCCPHTNPYLPFNAVGLLRFVKKDFVFSDGTVVPAGNQIAVASHSTHTDEVGVSLNPITAVLKPFPTQQNYEDPLEFKPWRFSDKRKEDGEGIRHQMVTTSLDYLLFGGGRPAW